MPPSNFIMYKSPRPPIRVKAEVPAPGKSMGTRNLGTGRAAMPEPEVEPEVKNFPSNSETLYNKITSDLGGLSPGRVIVNYINNHLEEFPQHRINELIEYAVGKRVNFDELTIPGAEKKGIASHGGRTRKMRRGTRKMRARKGKSRRSRR
jgi:hypothetical protein